MLKKYINYIIISIAFMLILLISLIGTGIHEIAKECHNIIKEIEKHSVHPEYGNYIKIDNYGNKCEPWNSCYEE